MTPAESRLREAVEHGYPHHTLMIEDGRGLVAEFDRLRAAVQHEADCVEAAKAEIDRLTRERDEAQAERDAMQAALNTIARTPAMPFPDPGAHSARAYHEAVFVAWSRSNQTARAALARIDQEKANGNG